MEIKEDIDIRSKNNQQTTSLMTNSETKNQKEFKKNSAEQTAWKSPGTLSILQEIPDIETTRRIADGLILSPARFQPLDAAGAMAAQDAHPQRR